MLFVVWDEKTHWPTRDLDLLGFGSAEKAEPQRLPAGKESPRGEQPRRSFAGTGDRHVALEPLSAFALKVRCRVLGLLVVASIIIYEDRVLISTARTSIQEDLGLTLEHWGWPQGAFVVS